MILSIHMAAGAILGNKMKEKTALILICALLSHYALDFIPHFEYLIKPPTVFLDLLLGGIITITIAYQNRFKAKTILVSAFLAILPDGLLFSNYTLFKNFNNYNFLKIILNKLALMHNFIHTKITFTVPDIPMQITLAICVSLAIFYFVRKFRVKSGTNLLVQKI